MQKLILPSLILFLLTSATALGQSRLKTTNSVAIKDGFIVESVVLADASSQLFLEFIKNDRVAKSLDGQIYTGEILPPVKIDSPAKAPRARMREVLSFEVISDTSEALELIDQFSALHSKVRLRQSLSNQAGERTQGAQLIALFDVADEINNPALWRYMPENPLSPWKRLGGITGETPAGEDQIFSAYLFSTGTFTIWDENPLPTFEPSFINDEIEFAEPSPYPSVTEEEEELSLLEEADFVELLEGDAALFEDELETLSEPEDDELTVPAVSTTETETGSLIPAIPEDATTTSAPAPSASSTTNPSPVPNNNSDFLLAPPTQSNTTVPASPSNEVGNLDEISVAQALQANSFTDFGTNDGDLPVAGGIQFPWFLLILFGIIGFSIYAIRQKPY